jgi:hypothetical protein
MSGLAVCGQSFAADQSKLADSPRIRTLDEWLELQGSGFKTVSPNPAPAEMPAPKQSATPSEPAASLKPATVILTSAQVPASESTTVSSPASVSTLAADTIHRLLSNACRAVAAGDLPQARLLAEVAAEMPVPMELFQKHPERILDEIAYMTSQKQDIMTTAWNQEAPAESAPPATGVKAVQPYDELVKGKGAPAAADGREFRVLGTNTLKVGPITTSLDGDRLVVPQPEARSTPEAPPGFGHCRDWTALSYAWEAPVARHQPLYFEDPELERYGNEFCLLQPVVSGTRFYLTFATMPYQMSIPNNAWFDVKYDLGHDRPGNCVPYSIHTLPVDWTAGLSATGIITGLAFALMTP